MPKLFLYKAAKANIVAILRRGENRETWELIRWDLDTDTFTEGQWLLKKHMNGRYAAISPCGRYFGYHYDVYGYVKGVQEWTCHGVVSALPNFTALYFNGNHRGNWEMVSFTEDSEITGPPMLKKGDVEIPQVGYTKESAPSGYTPEGWTDPKGRLITTEAGKLLADGVLLYDTTNHVFVPKAASAMPKASIEI